MSAEGSAVLEANESQPQSTEQPVKLRIARHPVRDRIERLVDLAATLLEEAERLSQDRAFTEESSRLRSFNLSQGIDFYDEVKRFESGLIKLALERTGGNQAKAAKLLRIKPTTLNSKIKLFQVEY